MSTSDTQKTPGRTADRQLQGITLDSVIEKRRLDQALNAKEFAVCAGVSYSTARHWFHLPGFPVLHGVIFWQDFVQWRTAQNGLSAIADSRTQGASVERTDLPARAAHILLETR
jgi:hypothetical protein